MGALERSLAGMNSHEDAPTFGPGKGLAALCAHKRLLTRMDANMVDEFVPCSERELVSHTIGPATGKMSIRDGIHMLVNMLHEITHTVEYLATWSHVVRVPTAPHFVLVRVRTGTDVTLRITVSMQT